MLAAVSPVNNSGHRRPLRPAPQRHAIVLRIWDQMEFAEIGRLLGESADTIRKRYDHGVRKLQELMRRGS